MRRALSRGLATLAGGLALAMTLTAGTAVAGPGTAVTPWETGVSFGFTGDVGQCNVPGQYWAVAPDWTPPIRFNTDGRSGGCQFAFGVRDLGNSLAGLQLYYDWQVSSGGDARQCGNTGTNLQIPITPFLAFGASHIVDTDDKSGWCNLTFRMEGSRTDLTLDIQFWPDGATDQCRNFRPQGQSLSVRPNLPVTIGISTDDRSGGCWFSMRVR
jgi:hypothetical protein